MVNRSGRNRQVVCDIDCQINVDADADRARCGSSGRKLLCAGEALPLPSAQPEP